MRAFGNEPFGQHYLKELSALSYQPYFFPPAESQLLKAEFLAIH
jgi:hypothetical protein